MRRRPLLAGAALWPVAVRAQQAAWAPTRSIRLIVAFAPGGSADALARRLGERLTLSLGQTVVVENRPGGGGNIAMDVVAKSAPDGHTLALGAAGPHAINPALFGAKMPYDAARDFTPVIYIQHQPNILAAHPSVPAGKDATIAWLRANRQEPYGSPGAGSGNHLTGAMLSHALGLDLQHVPYRGSAPGLTDLVAGQIRLFVDNIATTAPLVREGRLRGIAVSTAERSASLPEVPSFVELGFPGIVVNSWQGIFAPAGLPAPALARLNAAFGQALRDPGLAAWLAGIGGVAVGGSPEEFARFLAGERTRWAEVVRVTGVTVD